MCSYYEVPDRDQLVLHFGVSPDLEWREKMSPLYRGPFVRAQGAGHAMVVGQWGMIPPRSEAQIPKTKEGKRLSTFNARREGREWTDPASGEVVPNFTMMTQNCDQAPVFNLMHRHDPKRPDHMQDKRMVVPLEKCDWNTWLHGTLNEAEALIRVPPLDLFVHGPLVEGLAVTLPSQ